MSSNATELLESCGIDANRSDLCESELRALINRVYYSTYHELKNYVRVLPKEKDDLHPSRIGHREVFRRLQAWKHPDVNIRKNLAYPAKLASMLFIRLIETREQADYDLSCDIDADDADSQADRRVKILEFLDRYQKAINLSTEAG
jgi:uncharacterized protein (UPF0332 family)